MRQVVAQGLRLPRLLTGWVRLMPDFIIIGVQRCGTTSLYNYLIEHPNVAPAFKKEVHFFDKHFKKGPIWYRAHFPSFFYASYVKQIRRQDLITGEATPYYIFYPHTPKRILETVPQAKLIVLLRNPVDRAYSHYHHEVRMGTETLSFERAIEREEERLYGEMEKTLADENYYSFNHQHYAYLSRGIYVDQLKTWMSLFSREQILLLGSEDFYNEPPTVLKQVIEFIELPAWELKKYRKYNYAHYSKMDATIRRRLIDYFKPHNQKLCEYLDMNFGWDT
jgi:hypothetical protein